MSRDPERASQASGLEATALPRREDGAEPLAGDGSASDTGSRCSRQNTHCRRQPCRQSRLSRRSQEPIRCPTILRWRTTMRPLAWRRTPRSKQQSTEWIDHGRRPEADLGRVHPARGYGSLRQEALFGDNSRHDEYRAGDFLPGDFLPPGGKSRAPWATANSRFDFPMRPWATANSRFDFPMRPMRQIPGSIFLCAYAPTSLPSRLFLIRGFWPNSGQNARIKPLIDTFWPHFGQNVRIKMQRVGAPVATPVTSREKRRRRDERPAIVGLRREPR
jgi:hypothetical protein